jgi:NADP-dependent 3-hydroxy acid dehydrogenase YdfG
MNLLEGKVALVSGAGSGIGKAAAELLAQQGVRVGLVGVSREELQETQEEIERQGGKSYIFVADISDAEAMQHAVKELTERWGRLDIVFANAGINGVWWR